MTIDNNEELVNTVILRSSFIMMMIMRAIPRDNITRMALKLVARDIELYPNPDVEVNEEQLERLVQEARFIVADINK